MLKRTEITIETERFLVVSRRSERTVLWCNQCGRMAPMITVYEAARILSFATSGLLHFAITPEGRLFICSDSLGLDDSKPALLEGPTGQHFDVE